MVLQEQTGRSRGREEYDEYQQDTGNGCQAPDAAGKRLLTAHHADRLLFYKPYGPLFSEYRLLSSALYQISDLIARIISRPTGSAQKSSAFPSPHFSRII
jgi:hypothetical protein